MELTGRLALVTGAGHRLGRAIAQGLAERGMDVAVHYHASEAPARVTAASIVALGRRSEIFPANLGQRGAPAALVKAVSDRMGDIAVVINSAAVMKRTPWDAVSEADWDDMFALNLRAAFFVAQAAALRMRERGGVIVNIADLAAFETWPAYIPHSITKAGVVQMTRGLARVLGPTVRVNAVAPGAVLLPAGWSDADARSLIETTPLQRLGSPADVVGAVLYLLEADFITGETIIVDGGRHVRS
jgi:NAD(P)-dependent dehydrogenase (short-subunit alcohol dehydrogenase family)